MWRSDGDDDFADYTLYCVVDALGSVPEDRWLSVAETFEFLTAEE